MADSSIFDAIFGSDDPATADSSGLTSADHRQVGFGGLSQMGAMLMAAGQPMWGNERARYLAGLGSVPGSMMQQRRQLSQTKLDNTKAKAAQVTLDNQQKLIATMQSPEFQAAFANLPPAQQAAVKAAAAGGDIKAVNDVLQMAQPKVTADGSVIYGGYLIDPMFGTRTPIDGRGLPAGEAGAADAFGDISQITAPTNSADLKPGERNEAWLSALAARNPGLANMIKMYSDGRMPVPTGAALRNPRTMKILNLVPSYDSTFDAGNYGARVATMKDFTAGVSARNVTSFNTLIGHLGQLHELSTALDNGQFPTWNAMVNEMQRLGGHDAVNRFNQTRNAVIDEASRAFKGITSEADIARWKEELNSDMSPKQLQGVISDMVHLLNSRIDALGEQWSRGTGRPSDGFDLLDPKANTTLRYISKSPVGSKSGGGRSVTVPATPPGGGAVTSSFSQDEIAAEMRKRGLIK